MNGFQLIKHKMPTVTYVESSSAQLLLKGAPLKYAGQILHTVGIAFECTITPTLTTAPTVTGLNALITNLVFNDGRQVRFNGSLNDLRFFERLESGGRSKDAVLVTTDTVTYLTRTLWFGPPTMAGFPDDFGIPNAALQNGNVTFSFSAITAYSADTTALTMTIQPVLYMIARQSDIIQPAFYERKRHTLTSNVNPLSVPGLIANLSLANSTSFDAFTAGDIDDITLSTGLGTLLNGVDAGALTMCYNEEWLSQLGRGLLGDPRTAAYELSIRQLNLTTPTALEGAAQVQQPVLWTTPGCKMSRLMGFVPSTLQLDWSGAAGSGTLAHMGRFVAQDATAREQIRQECEAVLGIKTGVPTFKTLQGGAPGYLGQFMASHSPVK